MMTVETRLANPAVTAGLWRLGCDSWSVASLVSVSTEWWISLSANPCGQLRQDVLQLPTATSLVQLTE